MAEKAASRRLAIVGTGLIGASVGLAAKRAGFHVLGFDPDPPAGALALESGALDELGSLGDALTRAELAVVAAPVGGLAAAVARTLESSDEHCTVTDVGSTKRTVCAGAAGSERFVGGHPISGGIEGGAAHARADLFDGSVWFLTPLPTTEPRRYELVRAFVAALGANPVEIGAEAHDRLLALTSHLPHALANLLVNQAGGEPIEGHDPFEAAGRSLRDLTRIAGANPSVWVDVMLDNRDELRACLRQHRRLAGELERALAERDADFLSAWIEEARRNRERLHRGLT